MLVNLRLTETMRRAYVHAHVDLIFTIFALLAAYQLAKGQESLQLPTLERQKSRQRPPGHQSVAVATAAWVTIPGSLGSSAPAAGVSHLSDGDASPPLPAAMDD
jgi:hypothetical protein